jgi:hypothetical protein
MQNSLFTLAGLALVHAGFALHVCRTRSARMQYIHFAYEGLACQESLLQDPLGSSRIQDSLDSFPFVITLRMQ